MDNTDDNDIKPFVGVTTRELVETVPEHNIHLESDKIFFQVRLLTNERRPKGNANPSKELSLKSSAYNGSTDRATS